MREGRVVCKMDEQENGKDAPNLVWILWIDELLESDLIEHREMVWIVLGLGARLSKISGGLDRIHNVGHLAGEGTVPDGSVLYKRFI